MNRKTRVYLDYAATTAVDPQVFRAMEPYFTAKFGNPGSLHSFGQEAIAAIDRARETIARAIGAEFREIIFTGSATEANNLALRGIARRAKSGAKKSSAENFAPRVIVSSIEHESVLEPARELEREGAEVVRVPVDSSGIVDLKKLKESLNERTVLVSVMYANHEIGAIQPIAEIAKIVNEFKNKRRQDQKKASVNSFGPARPFFHTDVAQAFQFLPCGVRELGIDMMTLSSHKIYGPKGAAALYIRGGTKNLQSLNLKPLILGGGQEYGLRSGTENVPAIVGFAIAAELAVAVRDRESKRVAALRDSFWRGIKKKFPNAARNGAMSDEIRGGQTLPNILNVYFPGRAAQDLLTRFDLSGLAASSGSACRARSIEPSYVIEALGYGKERAASSIRFSLGRPTTKTDIARALEIIENSL